MNIDEKDWRKLCALVAEEQDPQRLSKLVAQLIKALDARREELDRNERRPQSLSGFRVHDTKSPGSGEA